MSSDAFIPLCVPHIDGSEWTYVKECLDTGWVSSVGKFVDRFETEFAAKVGAKYAVACASGTAAIHIALILAGVQAGDEVIVSTLTFIAPVNAIRYVQAFPVLMDAEDTYLQMDVEKLRAFLVEECEPTSDGLRNRKTGRRVSAIVPVHVLGHPCDMAAICKLAEQFELKVIEDATESLGSKVGDKSTGTFGVLGCFSFNGNKIITTGSGGMIVTDDESLARRAKYLTTQAKDDAVEFIHGAVGYNYRLSNVSAAIGVAQLEQLDGYVARKRAIAHFYDEAFADVPGLTTPKQAAWARTNAWLYTIRVDEARFGMSSRALARKLAESKIETRPLWQPIHRSPAHPEALAFRCEMADVLQAEMLSIPCSVGISVEQREKVANAIQSAKQTAPHPLKQQNRRDARRSKCADEERSGATRDSRDGTARYQSTQLGERDSSGRVARGWGSSGARASILRARH